MKSANPTHYILSLILLLSSALSFAQSPDSLVASGDVAHMNYAFDYAVKAYSEALSIMEKDSTDTLGIRLLKDKLLLSENGRNMRKFTYSPAVVARHRFSIEDFYLYYPLPDKSWRPSSNLTGEGFAHPFHKATYAPEGAERIFYSAADHEGICNIYMTELEDSLWSVPAFLNEHMLSAADEIYPMLSPDGRTLYFASKGLYGVGGYDIYMSEWSDEENDWAEPVNMGFPYSSPADDFLFVNSPDGHYTMFASNRECSSDSVYVYVLEYDSLPVRKEVNDPEHLRRIASLELSETSLKESGRASSLPEDANIRRYVDKMNAVRALRDSVNFYQNSLEDERNRFALSNDVSERVALTDIILRHESKIPDLKKALDKEISELQDIEMDLLFNGITINPEEILADTDREVVGDATSYVFTKMDAGEPLVLAMKQPQKQFDYSFRIEQVGQFAEDNTIPSGIVYQIQIFSSKSKASVKSLRGLSPVFEKRYPNTGTYVYRVGLFRTYNDVISKLNAVKKAGFRSAFIVAYIDGEEVKVASARNKEHIAVVEEHLYRVSFVPGEGGLDQTLSAGIRMRAAGKDMARSEVSEGVTSYSVGPFSDKRQAEELADFIKSMGVSEVSVDIIGNTTLNE